MRKSVLIILILGMAVLWLGGCEGKYSDAIKVNEKFIKLNEEYIDSIEKASSGKDVAQAMNRFSDGFEKLAPEMQKIMKKYPELHDEKSNPKEFEKTRKKAEEVANRFGVSFMKVVPYMKEPEVQEAQKRMSEVLKQISLEQK